MKRFVGFVNRIPPYGFIIILISLNKLSWHLTGNEENYFAWARQFADPSWFPDSFILNEFPGPRLLFQFIIGPLLKIFPFELVGLLGKIILILSISWPLSRIIKMYKIENAFVFLVFQLFFINAQHFFAGSNMIGGFEASKISWTLLIFAVYNLLEGRKNLSLIFMIVATYFHILIGAWGSLAIFIYWITDIRQIKKVLSLGAIYFVSLLPFIIYLYLGVFSGQANEIEGVNLDWIYVFYRNPHHVGIFLTGDYFVKKHLGGVLLTICMWLLTGFVIPRLKNDKIKSINRLNFIALSILVVTLIIGIFDRTGWFLKFYPFRLSTLTRLLVCIELMILLSLYVNKTAIKFSIIILAGLYLIDRGGHNIYKNTQPYFPQLSEMSKFAAEETSIGDKFVFIHYNDWEGGNEAFMRKSHRDRLVSFKYVPAGGEKLYEWYQRLQQRDAVEKNIELLPELAAKYHLNYLVSSVPYNVPFLEEVFHNDGYYVFKISVK